jgi:hypothetical protein
MRIQFRLELEQSDFFQTLNGILLSKGIDSDVKDQIRLSIVKERGRLRLGFRF